MLPWLNPMGILAIAANCLATLDFNMDRASCQLAWREKELMEERKIDERCGASVC
jgi:hypothetical protein